jgi:hypothetical protein
LVDKKRVQLKRKQETINEDDIESLNNENSEHLVEIQFWKNKALKLESELGKCQGADLLNEQGVKGMTATKITNCKTGTIIAALLVETQHEMRDTYFEQGGCKISHIYNKVSFCYH